MPKVRIIVRGADQSKHDYSLDFDLPAIPQPGNYVSVSRPDQPEPYVEHLIVDEIHWRLRHPEIRTTGIDSSKIGTLTEVVVRCSQAVGPHDK